VGEPVFVAPKSVVASVGGSTPSSNGPLTYGELEALWIKAGGSKAMAPLMAAIAMAESSGYPTAYNPTDNNGTQTSWGLWQISNGTHSSPGPNPFNPLSNARMAVAKYRSQGLGAWGTYTSGAYRQFLRGGVAPSELTSAITGSNNGTPSTGSSGNWIVTYAKVMQSRGSIVSDVTDPGATVTFIVARTGTVIFGLFLLITGLLIVAGVPVFAALRGTLRRGVPI
jgi:hypothetical protein